MWKMFWKTFFLIILFMVIWGGILLGVFLAFEIEGDDEEACRYQDHDRSIQIATHIGRAKGCFSHRRVTLSPGAVICHRHRLPRSPSTALTVLRDRIMERRRGES